MAYYHTCPDCGAHLDPDERCDCEKEPPSGELSRERLREVI